MPEAPAGSEAAVECGENHSKLVEILRDDAPLGLDTGTNPLLSQRHTLLQVGPSEKVGDVAQDCHSYVSLFVCLFVCLFICLFVSFFLS